MKITIYTTPTCPYCKLVKEFLTEKSLPFEERDVSENTSNAHEMVDVSRQMGVPVTVIDGEVVVGWNKEALEEEIKRIE